MDEYIKRQNEETKAKQQAAYNQVLADNQASYDAAQADSNTAFGEIMRQMFDDNNRRKNETDAALEANRLNTERGSQAALSQENTLRGNAYDLDIAQENARRDIETARQAAETQTKAAVQSAIANADYNTANQLYTEFKTDRNIAQKQVDKLVAAGVMPDEETITKSGYDIDYVNGLFQKARQQAAAKAAKAATAVQGAKDQARSATALIKSALSNVTGSGEGKNKGNAATLVLDNMLNLKSAEERQIYILSALQNGMINEDQSGKLLLLGTQVGAWNKPKITALELGAIDGNEPVDAASIQKVVRAMYGNAPVAIPQTVGEAKTLIANYILNTSFKTNYDTYKTLKTEQLEYYAANGTPEEKTLAQLSLGVIDEDDLIARFAASQQYITEHNVFAGGEKSYTISRLFYNGYTEDEVTRYLATRTTEQAKADEEVYREMLKFVDAQVYANTRAASMTFTEMLLNRAGATLWNLGSGISDILSIPAADELEAKADMLYRSANIGLESIKDGKSDVEKFLLDAAVVTSDVAFDAMLNYLVPYGGLASLGIRAYEQGEMAARSLGLEDGEQQLYGLATAAIEVFTERMFSGLKIAYGSGFAQKAASKLTSRLAETEAGQFVSKFSSSAFGKLISAGLGEGVEEVVADFGQAGIDYAFGLTDSYEIDIEDVLYDGLLGSFIGLLGGGASMAAEKAANISNIREAVREKQLNRLGNTQMNFQQSQEMNDWRLRHLEQSGKNAAWQGVNQGATANGASSNYAAAQAMIARSKQGTKAALTQALKDLQSTGTVNTTEASVTAAVDSAISSDGNISIADAQTNQQRRAEYYAKNNLNDLTYEEQLRLAQSRVDYAKENLQSLERMREKGKLYDSQYREEKKNIEQELSDAEADLAELKSAPTRLVNYPYVQDAANGLGAATIGFTEAKIAPQIREWFSDVQEKHGDSGFYDVSRTQEERLEENGAVAWQTPKYDMYDQHISRVASNALNSIVTPEAIHNSLLENERTGKLSYAEITDDKAKQAAEKQIKGDGWNDSLTNFKSEVKKGKTGKVLVTKGLLLYNNAVTSGNYLEAIDILSYVQKAATSAAQTVQAMKILQQLTPDCQLYAAVKGIDSVLSYTKQKYRMTQEIEIDENSLENYYKALESRDEAAINEAWNVVAKEIAKQLPSSWRDKLDAIRYLFMLGNPRTHIRNIVGNLGFVPVWVFSDIIATGGETIMSLATHGEFKRTKAFLNAANPNDRALLAVSWKDYLAAQDNIMSTGKYVDPRTGDIDKHRKNFKDLDVFGKTIQNPIETLGRANTNALEFEDRAFAQPAYAVALAGYLKANGISANEYVENHGKDERMAAAQTYAIEEARKKTYRDDNVISRGLAKLRIKPPDVDATVTEKAANTAAYMLLEGELPYKKTPANLLVRATEYSPLGLLGAITGAYQVRKGEISGAELMSRLSAGLTGTGLVYLGLVLAREMVLVGGNDDDEKSKLDREQAYSVNIGDANITLDWLAPEALPVFVGVEIYNSFFKDADDASFWAFGESLLNLAEPITEMSMLSGINSMLDTISTADNKLSAAAIQAATSYITQFLPTLGGQIERAGEDARQSTFIDRNSDVPTEIQYALGKAFNKLPFAEYQQIDYYDAWGRPQETGSIFERIANNFINPAYVNEALVEDVETELARLAELGESGMYPKKPSQSEQVNGEYLTAEQYEKLTQKAGQLKLETVSAVTSNKEYSDLKDADKAEVIRDAYSYATAIAKRGISSDYEVPTWVEKAEDFGDVSTYIIARQGLSGKRGKEAVCKYIDSLGISRQQKSKLYEIMFPTYKNDYHWR